MRSDTYIKDDYKEKIRRHQQKIAEKYWKKKQISENGASKSIILKNIFIKLFIYSHSTAICMSTM
jgi:hypothetical protein